jgi:hypothetical protein
MVLPPNKVCGFRALRAQLSDYSWTSASIPPMITPKDALGTIWVSENKWKVHPPPVGEPTIGSPPKHVTSEFCWWLVEFRLDVEIHSFLVRVGPAHLRVQQTIKKDRGALDGSREYVTDQKAMHLNIQPKFDQPSAEFTCHMFWRGTDGGFPHWGGVDFSLVFWDPNRPQGVFWGDHGWDRRRSSRIIRQLGPQRSKTTNLIGGQDHVSCKQSEKCCLAGFWFVLACCWLVLAVFVCLFYYTLISFNFQKCFVNVP